MEGGGGMTGLLRKVNYTFGSLVSMSSSSTGEIAGSKFGM